MEVLISFVCLLELYCLEGYCGWGLLGGREEGRWWVLGVDVVEDGRSLKVAN